MLPETDSILIRLNYVFLIIYLNFINISELSLSDELRYRCHGPNQSTNSEKAIQETPRIK
jgi:hypothetical protein